jgi:hypothetical protein
VLRFLALICTVALTGLAAAAERIADGNVPVLSPLFAAVLPGDIHSRSLRVIVVVALQSACYAICLYYLKRLYGYAAGETEAAPRTLAAAVPVTRWRLRRPREGPVWSALQRLFASPTGRWLAPFAIPLNVIVAVALPLAFNGKVPAALWGLSMLYARTLSRVSRNPDGPDPLLEPDRPAVGPA